MDGNVRDCEDPFKPHNETEHLYSRRCVVGYLRFQAYHCVKIKGKREGRFGYKLANAKAYYCVSGNYKTDCMLTCTCGLR